MSYLPHHKRIGKGVVGLLWLTVGLVTLLLSGQPQPEASTTTSPSPSSSPVAALFPPPTKTVDCHEVQGLPDPGCTPGAINSQVTQDSIATTICVSGYTATIRPKTSYTNKLKAEQIIAYGYADPRLSLYEEDHLISLELGGSPDDPANLWPESYDESYGARQKDRVENYLHTRVCKGEMSLLLAQQQIATNWVAVYVAQFGTQTDVVGEDSDDAN